MHLCLFLYSFRFAHFEESQFQFFILEEDLHDGAIGLTLSKVQNFLGLQEAFPSKEISEDMKNSRNRNYTAPISEDIGNFFHPFQIDLERILHRKISWSQYLK